MTYIEREKLINELECLPEQGELSYLGVYDCVNTIPAADVVEVVHCKNCKCFKKFQAGHFCNKFGGIVTKEDYCSRGEMTVNNEKSNTINNQRYC